MENKNHKFEVEDFISKNDRKLAWFATSSILLRGYIFTVLSTDFEKVLEITDCQFMSVENQPKIEKFTVRIDEIYGWGLA